MAACKRRPNSLDKVVPEHARRILEHPHKRRHIDLVALDRRPGLTVLDGIELPQVGKPCEPPVALFGDKAVVSVWRQKQSAR